MDKEESEFGKGFIYCLFLFAKHWWHHFEFVRSNKEMTEKGYENFTEKEALSLWFNGAADHLFELTTPKSLKGTKIAKQVKELQQKAMRWRIAYGEECPSVQEFDKFFEDMENICMEIDNKLGCKPVKAQWS